MFGISEIHINIKLLKNYIMRKKKAQSNLLFTLVYVNLSHLKPMDTYLC